MASFVMHFLAGEKFLNDIGNSNISDDLKNSFRLGNLIVDSLGVSNYSRDEKLRRKMVTHFRDEDDNDKCIQIPNLDKFINKYKYLVSDDYSVMGYFFHLYTDKIFFEYLYRDVIEILDKDMVVTNSKKDNCYVRVLKNNKLFTVDEFYSGSEMGGLYRDYSNMNKYLIDKYNIKFDYDELKNYSLNCFVNPGIEEIDYNNIGEVIDKMRDIIKESMFIKKVNLNVFDVNDIDSFINCVVEGFKDKYGHYVKELVRNR